MTDETVSFRDLSLDWTTISKAQDCLRDVYQLGGLAAADRNSLEARRHNLIMSVRNNIRELTQNTSGLVLMIKGTFESLSLNLLQMYATQRATRKSIQDAWEHAERAIKTAQNIILRELDEANKSIFPGDQMNMLTFVMYILDDLARVNGSLAEVFLHSIDEWRDNALRNTSSLTSILSSVLSLVAGDWADWAGSKTKNRYSRIYGRKAEL